jgi:hypothetical protein
MIALLQNAGNNFQYYYSNFFFASRAVTTPPTIIAKGKTKLLKIKSESKPNVIPIPTLIKAKL